MLSYLQVPVQGLVGYGRALVQHGSYVYSSVTSSKLVAVLSTCGVSTYTYVSWYEYQNMTEIFRQWRDYNRVFSSVEAIQKIGEEAVKEVANAVCEVENVFAKPTPDLCFNPINLLSDSLSNGQNALFKFIGIYVGKQISLTFTKEILAYSLKGKMVESWLRTRNNQLALRVIDPTSAKDARYIVDSYAYEYITGVVERLSMASDVVLMFGKAYSVYTASTSLINDGIGYNLFYFSAVITVGYVVINSFLNYLHSRAFKDSQEKKVNYEDGILFNEQNALQVESSQARVLEYNGLRRLLNSAQASSMAAAGLGIGANVMSMFYAHLLDFVLLRKSLAGIIARPELYFRMQTTTDLISQVSVSLWSIFEKISNTAGVENSFSKIIKFKESIDLYVKLIENNKELKLTRDPKGPVSLKNLTLLKPLSSEEINQKVSPKVLISNLNVTFTPGQIKPVIGKSGRGKSCLFNVLFGVNPFAKGEISVCADNNIVYVPQKAVFKSGVSFKDTLEYSLDNELIKLTAEQKDTLDRKIERWISILALDPVVKAEKTNKTWASSLSGGEGQRVALLQALIRLNVKRMLEPESTIMLMLDESLGALDPENKSEAFNLLKAEVAATNAVALHIDHSEPEVIQARYKGVDVLDFNKLIEEQSISR